MSHLLSIRSIASIVSVPSIVSLVLAFGPGSATLRADTGGGVSPKGDCNSDVKKVDASSSCLLSTWCGGARGSSITYGGLRIGSSGGGSVDCCLTEIVIPPHTEVISGDKRIKHVSDVQGVLITRRCSSPFILFGIEFGSWVCETDSISPFGNYPIDRAEPCE